MASLVAEMVKTLPAMHEAWVQSLGREDSLEKVMATHSSLFFFFPLQYYCLEDSMDRGARWATVHGVSKSQTRLSNFHFTSPHQEINLRSIYQCSLKEYREVSVYVYMFV